MISMRSLSFALSSIAVLTLLAIACQGGRQETQLADEVASAEASIAQRLDPFLEAAVTAHDLPGLTVAVVQDGEVVYERAFGVESLDDGQPLTTRHLFHFASVSKPFVATAIMQLVEGGKIDLEEKVVTYLPYFELADSRYKDITIHQMLDHTSGMPDEEDYEWDKPQTDEGAAERYVRSLASEEMIGEPGESSVYSNMAFDTLGDVIAKVSGQSFEDYVKEHILDPLGMTESDFLYSRTDETLRTTGHIWDAGPTVSEHYPYNRRHAPSSTLNSNVLEMSRWVRANLGRGEFEGVRILEDSSYDVLWAPSAQMGRSSVGLSWFMRDRDGVQMIFHDGGDTGFASDLVLLPMQNAGFAVVANYDKAPIGVLRAGLTDILLGGEPDIPLRPIGLNFEAVYRTEGLDAAKAFYHQTRHESPGDYEFNKRQLNSVGYDLMFGEDDLDGAIEVLSFNVELYPDEGKCYYSLGEALLARGDKAEAVTNYRRAVELDPENDNARRVLEELGVELE